MKDTQNSGQKKGKADNGVKVSTSSYVFKAVTEGCC